MTNSLNSSNNSLVAENSNSEQKSYASPSSSKLSNTPKPSVHTGSPSARSLKERVMARFGSPKKEQPTPIVSPQGKLPVSTLVSCQGSSSPEFMAHQKGRLAVELPSSPSNLSAQSEISFSIVSQKNNSPSIYNRNYNPSLPSCSRSPHSVRSPLPLSPVKSPQQKAAEAQKAMQMLQALDARDATFKQPGYSFISKKQELKVDRETLNACIQDLESSGIDETPFLGKRWVRVDGESKLQQISHEVYVALTRSPPLELDEDSDDDFSSKLPVSASAQSRYNFDESVIATKATLTKSLYNFDEGEK